jgi:hypothetical protein
MPATARSAKTARHRLCRVLKRYKAVAHRDSARLLVRFLNCIRDVGFLVFLVGLFADQGSERLTHTFGGLALLAFVVSTLRLSVEVQPTGKAPDAIHFVFVRYSRVRASHPAARRPRGTDRRRRDGSRPGDHLTGINLGNPSRWICAGEPRSCTLQGVLVVCPIQRRRERRCGQPRRD